MRKTLSSLVVCAGVGFAVGGASAQDAEQRQARVPADDAPAHELTPESFERWAEYIRPDETEACWNDVHWRQSFREGVKDSQIEGKPILLWAMNGHPMGCV